MVIASVSLTVLTTPLHAQEAKTAKFEADNAAYCAASYGMIIEYLGKALQPETTAQAEIALMMWNYELDSAMANASEQEYSNMVKQALQKIEGELTPFENTQESYNTFVDEITSKASTCQKQLSATYPKIEDHPVVAFIQELAAAERAAQTTPQAN